MEIAHQLGKLFLGALPTVIVVLLFYYFMRWAFFGPIQKAMAERNARIEGRTRGSRRGRSRREAGAGYLP